MSNGEIGTCDFCRAVTEVSRQYLHAKNVNRTVGDGFTFIRYCSECGLYEAFERREYSEKSCSQCVLGNNNGVCDRKGCCNYQTEQNKDPRRVDLGSEYNKYGLDGGLLN